jgi:hypothetical protein
MWMALARLGLTLKRTPARVRASEQDRPDVAAARAGWALAAPAPDPARLVFPDETWATANVVRARGRAPRGERLAAAVPHGHWHTTTFLCGLRADGAASGPTVRPQGRRCGLRADGAASGPTAWSPRSCSTARSPGPPSWPTSNRRSRPPSRPGMSWSSTTSPATRSRACARRSRRAAGAALLYLPPCSPDLNPVELAFSKLKRLLQAAAARTVGALWNAIGRLLGHFSPAECAAYFSTAAIHSQADNGLATAVGVDRAYVARTLQLALLAPDIVEVILGGRKRVDLELPQLFAPCSLDWAWQREALGRGVAPGRPTAAPKSAPAPDLVTGDSSARGRCAGAPWSARPHGIPASTRGDSSAATSGRPACRSTGPSRGSDPRG